jgi:hypothetical protein
MNGYPPPLVTLPVHDGWPAISAYRDMPMSYGSIWDFGRRHDVPQSCLGRNRVADRCPGSSALGKLLSRFADARPRSTMPQKECSSFQTASSCIALVGTISLSPAGLGLVGNRDCAIGLRCLVRALPPGSLRRSIWPCTPGSHAPPQRECERSASRRFAPAKGYISSNQVAGASR